MIWISNRSRSGRSPLAALVYSLVALLVLISGAIAEELPVDLELVLAVDVSGSVDEEEGRLQRDGYISAIRSKEFSEAVKSGILGRIAVTYVEWAGDGFQSTIIDWSVINGPVAAASFADKLSAVPIGSGPWTSISDIIRHSLPRFPNNGYVGTRKVIDISGDGPNNIGGLVTEARDLAVARGITVNGLPILNDHLQPSGRRQIENLDKYYAACVIGGFGAFLVAAHDFKDIARAIRRKLIFEIAGLVPRDALTPPKFDSAIHKVQARNIFSGGCDIGEKRLQHRRDLIGDDF